jgi:membrane protease YdiL (CAAX protease family)
MRAQLSESRLATVEEPERALALVVGRTMDLHAALTGAPAWERRLYALTLTDAAGDIDQAIEWYEELAAHSAAPGVELRLAVLLGEAGRRERLERALRQWSVRGPPLAQHAAVLAAAYLEEREVDTERARETQAELGSGWFAEALALRLADGIRESPPRAGSLLWRLRAIGVLDLGLVLLGIGAMRGWRRGSRGARRAVADAVLPPPWSLGAGLAALVRGGALAALVLLGLLAAFHWRAERPLLAGVLDQPLMFLPLLLLVWRALLAPAGLGFVAAFGLWPRRDGWRPGVRAALVLIAAGVVIDLALGVLGGPLGLSSHWAEWFDPDLAWGSPAAMCVTLLGTVVFAPVFEELIFRGLLYGTLRRRLEWPAAALASAALFSVAHGYGLAGMLSVLVSGVLWAWVYERTGSLLPGIVAHAVNNVAVALALVALLR